MAGVAELVRLTWDEVPPDVRERVRYLLRDFAAVSVAGRVTATARLAAEHASAEHPGDAATALLDGRRLSATGAAWANGVLANALDFDDGHRLTKGHPGANVIPAALAAAEAAGRRRGAAPDGDRGRLRGRDPGGYRPACAQRRLPRVRRVGRDRRGGRRRAPARLRRDAMRHALGLAEYHAPIAPVMRSVADPAMTKDACGWGAFVGVSAALLARRGFTSVGSSFVELDRPNPSTGTFVTST